jgi:2-polyprenyl-6-hydroxyphenyl methylase/3-demethylubiquinone-9 3-methyltransferase
MKWKWKLAQAMEIRWWQYYLAGKTPADYLPQKAAYWHSVMRQAEITPAPGARVLDAGCGPAGIFMVLGQQQVEAVDPLLMQYEQTLPHFKPSDYPYVHFINSPLEDFQADQAYDLIFCLNAINHVSDIRLAMDRLVAALHPQGRLWLSIDAHRYPFLRTVFQRLPGDILHPHQYLLEEYRQMLTDRGLDIVQHLKLKPGRIFDYYLLEARYPDEIGHDKVKSAG